MFKTKDKLDRTLLKISMYVIITFAVAYAISRVLFYIPDITKWLFGFVSTTLSLLSPFICGLVIAYLVWPLVFLIKDVLFKKENKKKQTKEQTKKISNEDNEKKIKKEHGEKWKTGVSVLISYVIIIGAIFLLGYFTYAAIEEKFISFEFENTLDIITEYVKKYDVKVSEISEGISKLEIPDNIKNQLLDLTKSASNALAKFGSSVVFTIKEISKNVLNVFLGIIIAFYVIVDYDFFKKVWDNFLLLFINKKNRKNLNSFFGEINKVLSNFVRGQLLDCFIVAIISIVALLLIKIDFAIILGIFAGIANVIPYFGPIIGMVPAVIIALISGKPIKALFVIIVLTLVQQIDGNILAPKIVGGSVGIHPVFVIISVIIGAYLWGIGGMIIAVPLCGIIKVVLDKILDSKIKNERMEQQKSEE